VVQRAKKGNRAGLCAGRKTGVFVLRKKERGGGGLPGKKGRAGSLLLFSGYQPNQKRIREKKKKRGWIVTESRTPGRGDVHCGPLSGEFLFSICGKRGRKKGGRGTKRE